MTLHWFRGGWSHLLTYKELQPFQVCTPGFQRGSTTLFIIHFFFCLYHPNPNAKQISVRSTNKHIFSISMKFLWIWACFWLYISEYTYFSLHTASLRCASCNMSLCLVSKRSCSSCSCSCSVVMAISLSLQKQSWQTNNNNSVWISSTGKKKTGIKRSEGGHLESVDLPSLNKTRWLCTGVHKGCCGDVQIM